MFCIFKYENKLKIGWEMWCTVLKCTQMRARVEKRSVFGWNKSNRMDNIKQHCQRQNIWCYKIRRYILCHQLCIHTKFSPLSTNPGSSPSRGLTLKKSNERNSMVPLKQEHTYISWNFSNYDCQQITSEIEYYIVVRYSYC